MTDGKDTSLPAWGGEESAAAGNFARRWRGGGPGRLMLVETADLDGDGAPEIVAVAGRELKVFDWNGHTYVLRWETELPREGLALAAGPMAPAGPAAVAIGTRDAVLLYTVTSGPGLRPLCQTLLYPGAFFRSLDLADVNHDGRVEVVAAASGAQTMYVFQVLAAGGEGRLEELGRVYIGGLMSANSMSGGEVAATTREGYVDVYVPCSLLPNPTQALYCVKRGDSLWRLARKFGVSPGALARTNRLHEPYQLQPGQVLIIPPPPRGGAQRQQQAPPPDADGDSGPG